MGKASASSSSAAAVNTVGSLTFNPPNYGQYALIGLVIVVVAFLWFKMKGHR